MTIDLDGAQRRELAAHLRAAFTPAEFAELLDYSLGRSLDDIAMGADYREVMFKVVRDATRRAWTGQLISAALEANPDHPGLLRFARYVGLAVRVDDAEYERLVVPGEPFLDVATFVRRLAMIEKAVCRIEVGRDGADGLGTGFRIENGMVLTAAHLLSPVINGAVAPADVLFRFGYRRDGHGNVVAPGAAWKLAEAWLADSSPPAVRRPDGGGSHDELDFALIRVEPLDAGSTARSDISTAAVELANTYVPQIGRTVCVLQHPAGEPIKVTFGRVEGLADRDTRIVHSANTLAGSSGAPVLDSSLRMIGLHERANVDAAGHNAAVAAPLIRSRLKSMSLL